MKKPEELIWDHLDGSGSAGERSRLEARLSEDAELQEQYLQSKALHEYLQAMEVEAPSLRFTQNVMDSLPAVSNLATAPLVSRKWMAGFAGSMLVFLVFVLGGSIAIAPAAGGETTRISTLLDGFFQLFSAIPLNALMLAGIIGICMLSLLWLDRRLEARISRS